MQRPFRAIRDGDQVVDAESLAASVAVKLIAAGAEHLATFGVCARPNFKDNASQAIFVVLDRKALEERVAGEAGGGSELHSHVSMLL
jgi:hypothetical protein